MSDITSSEPAISREDRLVVVQVITLEVASGDRGSTNEDLAFSIQYEPSPIEVSTITLTLLGLGGLTTFSRFAIGKVSGFGHIEEFDFDGRDRDTSNTVLEEFRRENRAHAIEMVSLRMNEKTTARTRKIRSSRNPVKQ